MKSGAWQVAIELQHVDGLKTSAYLLDTAKEHIEGKISIDEAQKRIQSYYEERTDRKETKDETKEADIVSARITQLLGEKTFQFSPAEWMTIHRRLFEGVFDYAGKIRTYNIELIKKAQRDYAEARSKTYRDLVKKYVSELREITKSTAELSAVARNYIRNNPEEVIRNITV